MSNDKDGYSKLFDKVTIAKIVHYDTETVGRAAYAMLRFGLESLKHDLQLIAEHQLNVPPERFICELDVRSRGMCFIIEKCVDRVYDHFKHIAPHSVVRYATCSVNRVKYLLQQQWYYRGLNSTFPISIGPAGRSEYVDFLDAICDEKEWEFISQYALARIKLIDETLDMITKIEETL